MRLFEHGAIYETVSCIFDDPQKTLIAPSVASSESRLEREFCAGTWHEDPTAIRNFSSNTLRERGWSLALAAGDRAKVFFRSLIRECMRMLRRKRQLREREALTHLRRSVEMWVRAERLMNPTPVRGEVNHVREALARVQAIRSDRRDRDRDRNPFRALLKPFCEERQVHVHPVEPATAVRPRPTG